MRKARASSGSMDRRVFLSSLGCAGAAALLPQSGMALPAHTAAEDALLCLGSYGQSDAGTLHVICGARGRWERMGAFATERPMALAAHPTLPIVYAANGVKRYRHEPRGTMEAFLIDRASGRVEPLARQALSLSATEPRSLAVSPDGKSLLVAAFGGGAYNVLPLDTAGVPGAPSTILKQVGRGAHAVEQTSAHPAAVVFHPEGWAVAADFGADRLDSLTADGAGLAVTQRMPCGPGSGPAALAVHRGGGLVVAMQRLRPALMLYRTTGSGALAALEEVGLAAAPSAMAFHSERDVLYTTMQKGSRGSQLLTWQINAATGSLKKAAESSIPTAEIRGMTPGRTELWLASERGLIAVALDAETALPQRADLAAAIPGASSVAVL